MITSTGHQPDAAVTPAPTPALESLRHAFGADFRLALRPASERWQYADSNPLTALHEQPLPPGISEACDQVLRSRTPCVTRNQPQGHMVVVPLPNPESGGHVAVGEVHNAPADWLQRMADLWVAAAYAQQRADRLRTENDFFAEQLSDDLEELTFLRSMVEHLEVSDHSNDLMALAQSTLPLLNDSIKAECLALLMAPEGVDLVNAVPSICIGARPLPEALLMRIVERFGSSAMDRPVVKNGLSTNPKGEDGCDLREFVLVPVASRSRQMGWLLAVNRYWSDEERPESEWPLSQLEFGSSEASLLSTTASILATHASNLDLFREKEQILVSVVRSLVSALDAKDEYTCGHSERVALYGRILAKQAGCDDDACERLYMTGLLHDVGKIGVSDAILNKDGKLTQEEFAEIMRHPDEGWAILHDLEQLRYVLPGVLFHHERVDGTGYPDGLAGSEIPLDGRLLAIVDAYDAMTSDRPYRSGMPPERAQEILRSGAGTQWDAELVGHFFAALDAIEHVRRTYQLRQRPGRQRGCSN